MLSASGTPIPAPTGSLGLNSARLYGLYGSGTRPVGTRGSPYKQGSLADYASYLQPKEFDRRRIAGRRLSALKSRSTKSGAGRSSLFRRVVVGPPCR
jgi:hypothetical protein